jgi:hypothetical protein
MAVSRRTVHALLGSIVEFPEVAEVTRKGGTMKVRVGSLVVVLVAMFVVATTLSTYAQDPKDATAQAAANSPRTLDPAEAEARNASGKFIPEVEPLGPAVANPQTAVACNMCFTCGGDWPIFAGAVHAVNTGNLTFERGSGCSGTIHASNDNNPFLCCR